MILQCFGGPLNGQDIQAPLDAGFDFKVVVVNGKPYIYSTPTPIRKEINVVHLYTIIYMVFDDLELYDWTILHCRPRIKHFAYYKGIDYQLYRRRNDPINASSRGSLITT